MVKNYCAYIEEAYLISYVSYFSLKVAERQRNPNKVHAVDLGLRNAVSMAHSADKGRLLESLVCQHLLRSKNNNIYYFSDQGEVDFVVKNGTQVTKLIQVAYEGLDHEKTFSREMGALMNAAEKFPDADRWLLTDQMPERLPTEVDVIPFWKFFLCLQ